jgi:hypothetical protein
MQYVPDKPITVGDIAHQITIDCLQVVSLSFNWEPYYAKDGNAILSVRLKHPSSGYTVTVTYEDAAAFDFWKDKDAAALLRNDVLAKLMADGKLPPGALETIDMAAPTVADLTDATALQLPTLKVKL